jgi:hypothetical protein
MKNNYKRLKNKINKNFRMKKINYLIIWMKKLKKKPNKFTVNVKKILKIMKNKWIKKYCKLEINISHK